MLAIDDAHWADAASLRVLLDVQAELSAEPVMLLLASRPVENPSVQSLLAAMGTHPDCGVLTPATLTREGVAELVVDELGRSVDDAFVDECLRVSGGNAFYLHELMRQYQGTEPGAGPAMPSPGSLSLRRTVAARLGELGPEATWSPRRLRSRRRLLARRRRRARRGRDGRGGSSGGAARGGQHRAARRPVEFVHPLIRRAVEARHAGGRRG